MKIEISQIYASHGFQFYDHYFSEFPCPIITADGFDPIFNRFYPIVSCGIFRHFTDHIAAKNILKNEIWLSSAIKRINEHEFESLYEEFEMLGILDSTSNNQGITIKEEIAKTYFYLSLTDENISQTESDVMFNSFGKGDGAEFKFKITTTKPCLRKIDYSTQSPKILHEINDVAKRHGMRMTFNGAKLNAGIRLNHYSHERETRLYYSTTLSGMVNDSRKNEFPFLHIATSLKDSEIGFDIEILEVKTNNKEILEQYPTIAMRR